MAGTVIVADADRTTLELVTAVLTRDGFDVLATPDGGDALARFFDASPCLVVCAEILPGISGFELCRQIKTQRADTRVVILHSHAEGL
ncbi:response regulator transcription factor, partial [Myxococcota bacterium]